MVWAWLIVIASVVGVIWVITRGKEDTDAYDKPPEEERWSMDGKTETGGAPSGEKPIEEKTSEDGGKKDAGLAYGRGMKEKPKSGTKEENGDKEWESVDIYSYHERKDIWRCAYCDGENPSGGNVCHVCGKIRD